MDRRALAGLALCIVAYIAYEYYMKSKYADYYKYEAERRRQTSGETAPSGGTLPQAVEVAPAAPGAAPSAELKRLSPEELTVETDTTVFRFSQDLGGLESVTLKNYRQTKDKDSGPKNLIDAPMAVQGVVDVAAAKPAVGVFSAERQGRTLRFTRDVPGFRITQEFTVPETGYGAELKVLFTNTGATAMDVTAGLLASEAVSTKKPSAVLGFLPGGVPERNMILYRADDSTSTKDVVKFCKDEEPVGASGAALAFAGFDKHYFLTAFLPKAKTATFRFTHGALTEAACPVSLVVYDRMGILQPNETTTLEFGAYFGPKQEEMLKAVNPALGTTVHTGWLSFLGRPLLAIIEGFHNVTGNWGVSIILLTLMLKVLFFPLMKASATSAHRMKKLNPQMAAIRERYKDDPRKQQQELMAFMAQHKINPMKGCLPILPTIPVFIAFYQTLQTSIQLRHAPFFGWIQDLSSMDPYFITPVLMTVAMVVQQKLTPPTGMDKTQEKILILMPFMFGAMMATLPAGLTLYTLTNTVVGIVQQKWLYRKLEKQNAA